MAQLEPDVQPDQAGERREARLHHEPPQPQLHRLLHLLDRVCHRQQPLQEVRPRAAVQAADGPAGEGEGRRDGQAGGGPLQVQDGHRRGLVRVAPLHEPRHRKLPQHEVHAGPGKSSSGGNQNVREIYISYTGGVSKNLTLKNFNSKETFKKQV